MGNEYLNCICPVCGKKFHRKKSYLKKCKNPPCCSYECDRIRRKRLMSGKNNHQYGLKGNKNASFKGNVICRMNGNQIDKWVYVPHHPYADANGRVRSYRLVIEVNAEKFNIDFFNNINGNLYLKPELYVHHKDGNHNNDEISNLQVVTKREHRRIHNFLNPQPHDKRGRFISKKNKPDTLTETQRGSGGFGSTGR